MNILFMLFVTINAMAVSPGFTPNIKNIPPPGPLCQNDLDCPVNSNCARTGVNVTSCVCNSGFTTTNSFCDYQQVSELEAFLVSFFVGGLGVDWFILARGNGGYIAAGVFKLLTGGGLGIWWLVDWVRILAGSFPDGNGVAIGPW